MISVQKVQYSIAGKQILDNVSFQLSDNQHIGLVGRNGSGKSTIFNIIKGALSIDQGKLEISKYWKILSIKQEMPEGHFTPIEYLLSQDTERATLLKELDGCTDNEKMGDIYDRLIQIDAYTAESRAAKVLKGLGFNDTDQHRKLKEFSGGFRMRVALAATLYQEPDLLLLDEPTNHLDFETTQWLQKFLKRFPKSFILISHERDFLNTTVNSILHLKNGKTESYKGNFDQFIERYRLQQENLASYNTSLEKQREHMMKFVNRFRASPTKARQAQSRLKMISKMQFLPVSQDDPTVAFKFPEPESLSPPLISFNNINLGYEDNIILRNLSGSIAENERIALVGANGNGKTTFARFLANDLKHLNGEVHFNNKLQTGFYRQEQMDALDIASTAYQCVGEHLGSSNDLQIRSHLGRFGFSRDKVLQKIKALSGGERARLLFACLTIKCPNLLILDEPTNHLDIEMRESLMKTINSYNGSVILITHDRHLLKHVADTIWIVGNQKITTFKGDVTEYEKTLMI